MFSPAAVSPPREPPPGAGEVPAGLRYVTLMLVGLVAVVGLGLHVWMLGRSTIDSDSAVVGLMARGILHGHFSVFYWGQPYGGSEAYATAVLFGLFGASGFTLNLTATVLAGCCAVLTWRLGTRVAGPRVGAAAGLVFFVFPEVNDYAAVKEYGFRWLALACGLTALLLAARLIDGDRRTVTWIGLGLATGIGWWSTPEIVYQAVPVACVLGWSVARGRLTADLRRISGAAIGCGIGALPWIWANARNGFFSLHSHGSGSYALKLGIFFTKSFPLTLGLRLRSNPGWIGPTAVGVVAYVVLAAVVALQAARLLRQGSAALISVSFVMFPLLYALFPVTFWFDGRFTLALGPVVAILIVSAAADGATATARVLGRRRSGATDQPPRSRRPASAQLVGTVVAVLLAIALTAGAVGHEAPERPNNVALVGLTSWTSWHSDPNNMARSAIALMERHGVRDVFAGYWVAYVVSELSGRQVLATDAPLPVRSRADYDPVAESTHPAWLFVTPRAFDAASQELRQNVLNPGCTKRPFICLSPAVLESRLDRAHIAYHAWSNGLFVVVEPSKRLSPTWVLAPDRHSHD